MEFAELLESVFIHFFHLGSFRLLFLQIIFQPCTLSSLPVVLSLSFSFRVSGMLLGITFTLVYFRGEPRSSWTTLWDCFPELLSLLSLLGHYFTNSVGLSPHQCPHSRAQWQEGTESVVDFIHSLGTADFPVREQRSPPLGF